MPIIRSGSEVTSDMDGLYSEDSEQPSTSEESSPEESEGGEEKMAEPHTELISSKLLMGKSVKPGDKLILEVVKSYGDEVEVKYGSEKSKPDTSEDDQLAALAE